MTDSPDAAADDVVVVVEPASVTAERDSDTFSAADVPAVLTEQDAAEWLPTATAAKLLGVSFDTVVRRRKMGRLQGRKDDRGRWLVMVPASERTMAYDAAELPKLRARIVELERDRDQWRRQAQSTAATLAQLTAALPRLHEPSR